MPSTQAPGEGRHVLARRRAEPLRAGDSLPGPRSAWPAPARPRTALSGRCGRRAPARRPRLPQRRSRSLGFPGAWPRSRPTPTAPGKLRCGSRAARARRRRRRGRADRRATRPEHVDAGPTERARAREHEGGSLTDGRGARHREEPRTPSAPLEPAHEHEQEALHAAARQRHLLGCHPSAELLRRHRLGRLEHVATRAPVALHVRSHVAAVGHHRVGAPVELSRREPRQRVRRRARVRPQRGPEHERDAGAAGGHVARREATRPRARRSPLGSGRRRPCAPRLARPLSSPSGRARGRPRRGRRSPRRPRPRRACGTARGGTVTPRR